MILRILQIARIADAHHSVPPGSYPEAMVSVEKERVGRIRVIQLRIAAEYVAATFQEHQAGRPGADEKVAVLVFCYTFYAERIEALLLSIFIDAPGIPGSIGIEGFILRIEIG